MTAVRPLGAVRARLAGSLPARRRGEFLALWAVAVATYGVGDLVTTLRIVTTQPMVVEGNPLVAAAVATYGVPGLVGLKLAGVAVCLLVSCYGALVWDDLFAYYAPPVGLALVGAVLTANNLWLLG